MHGDKLTNLNSLQSYNTKKSRCQEKLKHGNVKFRKDKNDGIRILKISSQSIRQGP